MLLHKILKERFSSTSKQAAISIPFKSEFMNLTSETFGGLSNKNPEANDSEDSLSWRSCTERTVSSINIAYSRASCLLFSKCTLLVLVDACVGLGGGYSDER
uniref:Uncharacterized protein n=1 Tax=Lepeophtheirus salmonis TaxID=72036 RepID=A0A0K2TC21_LEPSM